MRLPVIDALGIPGVVDVHAHFMPDPVMRKVWAVFDQAQDVYGVDWPVEYRGTDTQRLSQLRELGVCAFTSLVYAHKPGMAAWLNDWCAAFAAATPDCLPTATFYPEPGVDEYVASAIDRGARIFKVHLQVGAFDPRNALLAPVWGQLAEAGIPVVVHCGSGPVAGEFTGPGPISEVVARNPNLQLIIAHMGAPEYSEFLALAGKYSGGAPGYHHGVHNIHERVGAVPDWLAAQSCSMPDFVVTCYSVRTSRTSRTPTTRQSMRLSGSASVMPGCDQCCTPTPPNCSV
ncbi:MAG: amidohydrolase family protein [Candidatus Nanopelagicales bacterium]